MRNKSKTIIISVLGIAMLVALFFGLSHFTPVRDYFLAASYNPSEFANEIAGKLNLTDSADLILRATHPTFAETNFSDYCTVSDADSAVLGCYTDGNIYVYRIDANELAGITESTTAHELLHAAWERLSKVDQDNLMADLNQIYKKHYDKLKIIETYPTSAQASELYARVGSEIADLPESLESHFKNYFKDRKSIVSFYNSYADVFNELTDALDKTEREVKILTEKIENDSKTYENTANEFKKAAAEFNSCAETVGCFASDSAFYARRAELISEQDRLSEIYDQISADITRHNELVEEYNSNLVRRQDLTSLINSNKEKENLNERN